MDTENNAITVRPFVEAIAYLLHETFEGSPDGQPSAYLRSRGWVFLDARYGFG